MASIGDWIHAARPKTLGAAVAPVAVGTTVGWKLGGHLDLPLALATLGSCIALQVATNWFNDALDHLKGADTAARLGPRRITAAGVVAPRSVMVAAWVMLGIATLLSVPLIAARGWPIAAIGVPSLYFCFGYTGGPMPLAYRGLGELFVILFFGLVAVAGSAFVQSGSWHVEALMAGVQVGCLSTVLIAINNLRDVEEDRSTGKRTLAVRFGVEFARREIRMLMVVAYALGGYWLRVNMLQACVAPMLVLPLGMWISGCIRRDPPGPVYNRYLALSGVQLLLFSTLLCIGLIISREVIP